MLEAARLDLAPTGRLRAGINLSNSLLVSGTDDQGNPVGISPDMAKALAERLGVGIDFVLFPSPGQLADAVAGDVWDVGLIADEPARAATINFSEPYAEIEATYLVPTGSTLGSIAHVDQRGIRIAVSARSAYDLWLERKIARAELVRAAGMEGAFALFVDRNLEALAGLRPRLLADAARLPGSRVLDGRFTAVQQAIGIRPGRSDGEVFLSAFVKHAKTSGLILELIRRHGQEQALHVAGYGSEDPLQSPF